MRISTWRQMEILFWTVLWLGCAVGGMSKRDFRLDQKRGRREERKDKSSLCGRVRNKKRSLGEAGLVDSGFNPVHKTIFDDFTRDE